MRDAISLTSLKTGIGTTEGCLPGNLLPVEGEVRRQENLGVSLMKGRYSEVLVGPSIIEKRNFVDGGGDIMSSAREAAQRLSDVQRYLGELARLGVNVPQTVAELDLTSASTPTIVLRSEKVAAPHNLIQLATVPWGERCVLISGMLVELLKIVSTQNGETPIGYDSGLDNFVTRDGRCYLVDVYPPRLGFRADADGSTALIDSDMRLINYPEKENLSPARQSQMRRFYYTPEGSIEHFATWAISAALIGADSGSDNHACGDRYQELCSSMGNDLMRGGREDLAQHLYAYLGSERGRSELGYRLIRTPQRFLEARKQWEATCHLF